MHSESLIGMRISEVRESTMHDLPTCVSRLINECCQSDPGNRIADMPALIERIELARTIISKRGETARMPDDGERAVTSSDAALRTEAASGSDTTGGAPGDDDSFDIDEFDVER